MLGEIVTSGQDEETDDELRKRFLIYVNEKPFGGNFIEYVQRVREIDGVGAVQVYPVWNGSGTVKVVVLDNDLNLASADDNQEGAKRSGSTRIYWKRRWTCSYQSSCDGYDRDKIPD